jgi:hypothetical protein
MIHKETDWDKALNEAVPLDSSTGELEEAIVNWWSWGVAPGWWFFSKCMGASNSTSVKPSELDAFASAGLVVD